jgi:hypothetical protein
LAVDALECTLRRRFPIGTGFHGTNCTRRFFCNVYLPWEREGDQQEGMQAETEDNNDSESFEESVREEHENAGGLIMS